MRRALPVLLLAACAPSPRTPHLAPPALQRHADAVDWAKAGEEAVTVLQGYLRVDTTNPPGTETAGAEYLRAQLAADGLTAEVHEFAPGRGSLVARLRAAKPSGEKPLCLLSHLDVVPAEAGAWPVDTGPLSGTLKDGEVWGRGALDMKGMGALELQVFRLLARQRVPLSRDVVLLAVADEEVGGGGMRLVAEQLWTQVDCGHVLNEGGIGVEGLLAPGQTTFAISVGEKGVLWLKVTATGEAGHGSTPTEERAPRRLVEALSRLAARTPTPRIHPALYELLRRAGVQRGGLEGLVLQRPALVDAVVTKRLLEKPPTRAAITDTCQVTGFEGRGSSPNVIPSSASAYLDCRVLPGTTPDALQAELQALVKDVPGITLEPLHRFEAGVSEFDDPFFDALARHAVAGRADAIAGPVISPGYTDSIVARARGARAYGFVPFEISGEALGTMHGRDERVSVKNVHRGLEVLFRAVVDVAAAD